MSQYFPTGINCVAIETTGPPTTGTWAVGDVVRDVAGDYFRCTSAGTPGTWATFGSASGDMLAELINSPYAITASEGLASTQFGKWVDAAFTADGIVKLPTRSLGKVIGVRAKHTSGGPKIKTIIRPSAHPFAGSGPNGSVYCVAFQDDGKMLIGGNFSAINGTSVPNFARINTDGTLDTTFMTNLDTGPNNIVTAIGIDSSGNIFIGGNFSSVDGVSSAQLAKINSDGTVNSTFSTNIGTGVNSLPRAIYVRQSDDKVFVGGDFITFNSASYTGFVALNNDGTLFTTFNTNTGTRCNSGGDIYDIKVDASGNFFLGGTFSQWNGNTRIRLIKLDSTGVEQSGWYTNLGTGGINGDVYCIAIQSDNEILIGGVFTAIGTTTAYGLGRLNTDGTPDTTFITAIATANVTRKSVYSIGVQSTGHLVVGGYLDTDYITGFSGIRNIVRFTSAGVPDAEFFPAGHIGFTHNSASDSAHIEKILIASNDDIVACGDFTIVGNNFLSADYCFGLSSDGCAAFESETLLPGNQIILRCTATGWAVVSKNLETDWYSETITPSAVTTPPTKGTTSVDRMWWKRTHKGKVDFRYEYVQSTGGANGSGIYLIPFIFTANVRYHNVASVGTLSQPRNLCGLAALNNKLGMIMLYDTTRVHCQVLNDGNNNWWSSANLEPWSGANYYQLNFSLTIIDL